MTTSHNYYWSQSSTAPTFDPDSDSGSLLLILQKSFWTGMLHVVFLPLIQSDLKLLLIKKLRQKLTFITDLQESVV
ncbi:hypothetical protein BT69DRAFT_1344874 [Atractiella rhizophila]|nr:hypothetical protein BT69DRAFT_1344874 [Atractiella rhizophila]